jgi:large subunit ribosomal protein L1
MKKHGKKYKNAFNSLEKIDSPEALSLDECIDKIKKSSFANFNETISADICLGVNPERSDQIVRGSILYPNKFKKDLSVIAFAKGDQAELATKLGCCYVGAEDLVDKILDGWIDFDSAVATPDLMALVSKTAKILGPKGLLPNKKTNTVDTNLSSIISDLKSGLLFFKSNKYGQVNFPLGKLSLNNEEIKSNAIELFKVLRDARPSSAKGYFFRKITLSSTMGIGFNLDIGFLNK